MYKILRIICCVIAAILAAGCVFVFIFVEGAFWGVATIVAAVCFFLLTLLFKNLQETKDVNKNPPPPRGDFITGPIKPDDDNGDNSNDNNN